ncbi:Oligomerization domain-containing protein, partial [Gorgonomyces haynaldii]
EIDGNELVDILAREAAQNISVIDVRAKCDHVDYMIICEGRSTKQVYSIADAVKRWAKHSYTPTHNMPHNLQVQGSESEDWMVVDLGDVIVHAFTPEARLHYDLDGLW